MGLLEKALTYKNKINSNGRKTIMDRIAGPAEAGFENVPDQVSDTGLNRDVPSYEDILYLKKEDLQEVEGASEDSTHDTIPYNSGGSPSSAKNDQDGSGNETRKPEMSVSSGGSPSGNGGLIDYMTLFELSRDILGADARSDLFDVILFSIMGQMGVTSSSIMIPNSVDSEQWEIIESRGVHINKDEINFRPSAGILGQLINRKEIIDIEEYKDNRAYIDDYYAYIAIDARMLVPLLYKTEVMGAIILGNKLTGENFTAEERKFLATIAEFSAYSYRTIILKGEGGANQGIANLNMIDTIQKKITTDSRGEQTREIIRNKFREIGIEGFAVFIQDETGRDYIPFICEEEDRLNLMKTQFRISSEAVLVREILKVESRLIYNDLLQSKAVAALFSDKQLKSMSMLTIFPHKFEGDLIGFTMIFGLTDPSHTVVKGDAARFCDFIFPYVYILQDIAGRRGKYIDSIEGTFKRIDEEIQYAENLRIPLTLVVLAIKNYKRYHSIYGPEKVKKMFRHMEDFIKARLSDRDFSVRYDRHKILIVLTGKDKKFAVPLANTVCNEMIHSFSTHEAQLLVTFLTAEFPLDGRDTYSLIDAVN
jgi:GGDEF domain-containing protein